MTTLYVGDEHHRLHWLWQEQDARDLALCHVDFHCDLRGLLIDRTAQRAFFYRPEELTWVDQGNFLTHAVHQGRVKSIDWLHDPIGGRLYDFETVAYERDLAIRRRPPAPNCPSAPLAFRERAFPADWAGPNEGEHLNLDWDALNCLVHRPAHARRLQRWFLENFPHADGPLAARTDQRSALPSRASPHALQSPPRRSSDKGPSVNHSPD